MVGQKIRPDHRHALILDQARIIAQPVDFHNMNSQSLNQLVHRFPGYVPLLLHGFPAVQHVG